MDPINALVLSAPPEWVPALILAALVLKGFTAWVDRKKTAQLLDATPTHDEPMKVEVVQPTTEPIPVQEITKDPDVKG